ncbi:immunoglobulin superfamily member 10-like isoform X4 [Biomphalaria glabrata]|uniref:Immunoglobulin superfamily member 10-like isoform X4 n=1 Tax=Biomphalaria glabrata TaxID=6526 RepID=A0A9W2ZHK8_BIOGL|nr:immunoglobulin superfamily member 10-like isoform X4 [Biomphalaria glabrata]
MFALKVACLLITLKSCCILIKATVTEKVEPLNTTSIENVTFIEGDIAILPCPFKTMGYLKVIWLSPDMTVISLMDRRFIGDVRMRVARPDNDTWNLHINNIRSKDTGYYQCSLNSDPVQTKKIYLDVKSAPTEIKKIQPMNDTTIHHVTETEGGNAILPCSFKSSATGYVQVVWMSSDMTLMSIEDLRITDDERVSVRSPQKDVWNLHINNVRPKDTGYYRCSLINDPVKTEMVYLHVKERTKTSTTSATFTTPVFVQTTTIFRKRTPDKATRGHHAKTTVKRPRKTKCRPISKCQSRRTRPTLRRTRPALRRTTPTLPSSGKKDQTSSRISSLEMRRLGYSRIEAALLRVIEAMKVFSS